jgi:hypothetical protein
MQIAVIGTGNVGSALGGAFARAGHTVTFASRNEAQAAMVAAETGSTAAGIVEAATAAEVVVLAVPYTAAAELAAGIADVAVGRIVIDATNPLKPDYSGLSTEGGPSGAEQLAALLPGAIVVKAFNTLFAGIQGQPDALGTPLDALFATDDDAAAATVAALASDIGFRPVKVGPLAAARELEALAWLNIRLQLLSSGSWQTSYVLVAPPAAALAA